MNDRVRLRIGEGSDAEAIRLLTREAYAKWVEVIGREPLPMRADYVEALKRHRFDLLYAGDELAALIETYPQGDYLLIENVCVRPAHQRRGYGRQLLKLAEDLSIAYNFAGVRLYTAKLFAENVRLYTSLGYQLEREEDRNGVIAFHMIKPRAMFEVS